MPPSSPPHPAPGRLRRRRRRSGLVAAGLVALSTFAAVTGVVPATYSAAAAACGTTNVAQGRPSSASSSENAGTPASAAFDGDTSTRWSSAFSDPQWIQVDLGSSQQICRVVLNWEAARAQTFKIQVSADGSAWSDATATVDGASGTQSLDLTATGRYVRMYGLTRATAYGYSLWEFAVNVASGGGTTCGTANVAQGKPSSASSTENAASPASAAFDGNTGTRWSSAFSDPQWIQVDLGSSQQICKVILNWEAAYAKTFTIQVSPDGSAWSDATATVNGVSGTQSLDVSATGRYVRMYGLTRATAYGYSLWEFAVNTTGGGDDGGPNLPGGGDLGPNVKVFDPSMPSASIQSTLDTIFKQQESNQFGSQRYALLFKPGTYSGLNAQIGFYTSIAGLGQSPDNVTINGDITVDAGWFNGNATQNFWRSAENLAVVPVNGTDRWAVAQAAPFRRIHVRGGLNLAPNGYGWASGGYIADSKVDGTVGPYSQQQWFTRDSTIGGWTNGVWNMVFSGVVGAPAQSFPNPPYTTLATSPVTREKPYLYVDAGGAYRVFVPSLRTNSSGVSWANGATPGTSIPLTQFYVAKPSDSAATLNQALSQGLNLLFTPGVYHLNQTLNVTRADTVVLGLGYATLIPDNGVVAMNVADVDGVKIGGLLFDAGTVNSPVLLRVGPDGASASHAANPTSIQDVFFRIGGAGPGSATTSLVVNSNNTIIDHIWAWRADHGAGVGWNSNPADTGLIVNGDNVTAYGLFVEHYKKYEVIWNGQGGKTIFFQNELPYDPPNQASWMNGSTRGYAAYKVADSVTSHEAWGMGSYCNFSTDPSIVAERGFEAPNRSGVKFHDLLTVSLGGVGTIAHVINDTGGPAQGTATVPVNVVSYP
ncbi:discoidin domain-containing protein [Microbispora sp. NEAU-D428]|uniref:discoidin domain-containing protein n=1 Tax=Microbispora sitophila TaxID=2771537 RepID=UPI0018661CD9|nr:discoidin domain-containing protein [Microbispora sitophila]MBE3010708.1 discoidin domain-containing protein [Microbispora sitophila]